MVGAVRPSADVMNSQLDHQVVLGNVAGSVSHWLLQFHGVAAYALVGALVFADLALLAGFFLPGETAAVVGGVLAGAGSVNLEGMMDQVEVALFGVELEGEPPGVRGPRLSSS